MSGSVSSINDLLLGPAGHRRVRVSQVLVALVVYVLFAIVQQAEVELGLIDAQASNLLTLFNLAGTFGFYLLVRSGMSEALADPAMTVPQMVWGVLSMVGSYAITGPARGAVMTLLVLILVFGMFALRPAHARSLVLLAFVLLSAVMLWKSRVDPQRYPPLIEAVHFAFAVIVLAGVGVLSLRMGALRARLKQQKDELAEALAQIRLLATQDELTGLFNRRHMTSLIRDAQARAQRSGEPLSLVLMDLDHFKRINDGHGHHAGDAVLRGFAEAGRTALRSTDVLARWGGEEFLLMLEGTAPEQAAMVVERIRAQLARASFETVAPGLAVTFSAGLVAFAPDQTLEQVVEQADQAMYRAKTGGRNRTVMA
ncbi:GGDEF domain-containing protein [Variovorax sp. YR752]|uniref:GGDEF domain-containing protein n=1 Tax=Variovorax sp. YR752 TaxID=1884383 RepID=UPI0031378BEE